MTRLQKLEQANKNIQVLEISESPHLFSYLLPEKMNDFLALTYFDEIQNKDFQYYLSTFRNEVLIAGINWCKESKLNETDWQKEYTLKKCKGYVSTVLKIINLAFEYYIGNKTLLLKDEL